jgi:hypothetical protein
MTGKLSRMSDKSSYKFCSREGEVSQSIAAEMQEYVFEAAEPVAPGKGVYAQMRDAAWALGFKDLHWRVKAAWYGEADSWSAKAVEAFRWRYQKMKRDRAKAEEAKQAKEQADFLKAQDARRAELLELRARFERLETAYRMAGPG